MLFLKFSSKAFTLKKGWVLQDNADGITNAGQVFCVVSIAYLELSYLIHHKRVTIEHLSK